MSRSGSKGRIVCKTQILTEPADRERARHQGPSRHRRPGSAITQTASPPFADILLSPGTPDTLYIALRTAAFKPPPDNRPAMSGRPQKKAKQRVSMLWRGGAPGGDVGSENAVWMVKRLRPSVAES